MRGHDRAGERIAKREAPGRDEAVDDQHDAGGEDQRDAVAKHVIDDAAADPELPDQLSERIRHELGREVEHDGPDDEHGGSDDEDHVDELPAHGRPSAFDAHRDLEPGAQRGHHPRRGPAEDEEADQAEAARRRRQPLDLASDVRRALVGEREGVDDLLDHVVPQVVVPEHDPEDRDEDDRERDEREEDAVGDARGVLRAAVGEVAVDRLRDHAE